MNIGRRALLLLSTAAATARTGAAGLQPICLGLLHTLSPAPFYIAQERGYFRDQGIDLTFRFFEAAQPIAAAAVAGDIDVGVTALTGGFFNLAEKGALKVIGGGLHEEPNYQGSAILASDKAFDAGLTAPARLGGHSVAITQYGSSFHYMIGRIAEKLGFDAKTIVLRPVQMVPNMIAAVQSGQVDATIAIASHGKAAGRRRARPYHRLGGTDRAVSDHRAVHHRRMIRTRADALHRFAAAYRQGRG